MQCASWKVQATKGMDAFVQYDGIPCEHTRTLTFHGSIKVLDGSTIKLYVDGVVGHTIK